jgi:hypothetical protein
MIVDPEKDYHKILGLNKDAGPDDIKRAYRQLAKKYHPDINKSPDAHDQFIMITEAYEILTNHELHEYYSHRESARDTGFTQAQYEKAREEARESARRYARMKYEKFIREQEAFKKSGWHDLILTIRYFLRIMVFPFIIFLAIMPLVSEEVSQHPSGYVMFWLLATILILFVVNNWKNYLKIDDFYYHLSDIRKLIDESGKEVEKDCFYCPGQKAMSYPHKISLFRVKNIQLKSYGGLYDRTAGVSRIIKTIAIPRSKRAFMLHSISSLIKITILFSSIFFLKIQPFANLSIPAGIIAGSVVSWGFLRTFNTHPKTSYLLSYGMIIKVFVWVVSLYFFGSYALILLFFDPMLETILRQISGDRLFIPILKQHPSLDKLFRKRYQVYMELPVWSVINPFFRWIF